MAAWARAEAREAAPVVHLVAPVAAATALIADPGFTVRSSTPFTLARSPFVRLEAVLRPGGAPPESARAR